MKVENLVALKAGLSAEQMDLRLAARRAVEKAAVKAGQWDLPMVAQMVETWGATMVDMKAGSTAVQKAASWADPMAGCSVACSVVLLAESSVALTDANSVVSKAHSSAVMMVPEKVDWKVGSLAA